jgi:pimeloyl-ACP methyl ester carboxylesterase
MTDTESIIKFTTFDGLRLEGTLSVPSGKPIAAGLLVHGITSNREEWGLYSGMASSLAKFGVATFRFDFRCHGIDPTPMEQLSLGGILNDIDAAYSTLRKAVGSTHKSFVFASSFGGGVSAIWAKQHSKEIDLCFLCAPVIDYVADIAKSAGDWKEMLRRDGAIDYAGNLLGRPLANEAPHYGADIAFASPMVPILIFHGTEDSDVPISLSRRYASLSENCDLIEIEGAEHGLVNPENSDSSDPRTQANFQTVYQRVREVIVG